MTGRGARPEPGTFAQRLGQARRFAGVSAADLSLMLGLDRGTVSRWERTGDLPDDLIVTSVRIAALCGVDHLWLLAGGESGLANATAAGGVRRP